MKKTTSYKKHFRSSLYKITAGVSVLALVISVSFIPSNPTQALGLLNRSLTLEAGTVDGGSLAGGDVNHQYHFEIQSASATLGSVLFNYCQEASGGCTAPAGLDAVNSSNTAFGNETSSEITGWSFVSVDSNTYYITRTASTVNTGSGDDEVNVQINRIINPSAVNDTFFVQIAAYASEDTTGSPFDEGTVAASTAEPIEISGTMPESLVFCTGATVPNIANVPDCPNATAGTVTFNQLFSPTDTAYATSQMAASTNATDGYAITVNGETLEQGSDNIAGIATASASTVGIEQFGLNLKDNAAPNVGTEVSLTPDGSDLRGQAFGDYDTADIYKFVSGEVVAQSDNGGLGPSNGQIFTVSYIANVPGNQPAGLYTTTLTYICTPTY